jgi:hypothetical protein
MKTFEFQYPPCKGKHWASLYRAALRALPATERLCLGSYQTSDYKGVCATSVVALNLNSVDQLLELRLPVKQKYKQDGIEYFVFKIDEDLAVRALQRYIERNYSESEVFSMAGFSEYTTLSSSEIVAAELRDFIVKHNDRYPVEDSFMSLEEGLPANDPARIRIEKRRAKYVRQVLRDAAEFAERG